MISEKMQAALNDQIQKEMASSYLYLSMSAWFAAKNLSGFAHWMSIQAEEERGHAMKFFSYLLDRGGEVRLQALAAPQGAWGNSLEAFREVAAHEAFISASINSLYELAQAEKDYPTQILLQWYISEQVEEEKNAAEIVQQLELIDARGTAVLMLDHRLGKRGE